LRWKGILFIIILIVFIFILGSIFTDNWLEMRIEKTASGINGSLVEIDGLDLSLLKMDFSWDRIQITNPDNTMKNMVETGECKIDLAFVPLLYRDIVINQFQISDFQTGTTREKDGKLVKKKKKIEVSGPGVVSRTSSRLYKKLKDYSGVRVRNIKDTIDPDSLLAAVELHSIDYIDSLRKVSKQKYNYWSDQLDSEEIQNQMHKLEDNYNEIKAIDPDSIKSVDNLRENITLIKKTRKNLINVRDQVENLQNNMNRDIKEVNKAAEQLQDIVQSDYRKVQELARIPDLSPQNIANFIFGDVVVNRLNGYLEVVAKIRKYYAKVSKLKRDDTKKAKPERFEGQDIQYSGKYNFPKFWIKDIELSGKTHGKIDLRGQVKNIVSDQNLIDAPAEINLTGENHEGVQLVFQSILDNRSQDAQDVFSIEMNNYPLDNVKLSKSDLFPYKFSQGRGDLKGELTIDQKQFNGNLEFTGDELGFAKLEKATGSTTNSIIEILTADIDKIILKAELQRTGGQTDFRISSNLDDMLKNKLDEIASEEIEAARSKIEKSINQKVGKARSNLENDIAARTSDLRQKSEKYVQQFEKYENELERKQKEFQKRIQDLGQEQIDDLKKKGKEKLDDLFQ